MRNIFKAVIFEIIPLFIMFNMFFVFLMLLEQMVQLADIFFLHKIPITVVLKLFIAYLPVFLVFTMPISTLLSVLIAFSRFSSDSELIAMHACGASKFYLTKPVLYFGVVVFVLTLYMNLYLVPRGSGIAMGYINKMLKNISVADIREKELYDSLDGMVFYADQKLTDSSFKDVILVYSQENSLITAQYSNIAPNQDSSLLMEFKDGTFLFSQNDDNYAKLSFEKLLVNLPVEIKTDVLVESERVLTVAALKSKFDLPLYKYEYYKRIAFSFSALLMSLAGFVLGNFMHRGGRSFGIVIALAIAASFNVMTITASSFVERFNPIFLAFMPDIVFVIFLVPVMIRFYRRV